MTMISHVSDALHHLLCDYPSQIERSTHFVQRRTARLTGPVFVQGLIWAWMASPDASYTTLCEVMNACGASVTPSAVEQRFGSASVELLKAVVNEAAWQVISSDGEVPELLDRFEGVWAQDGTLISLPEELAAQYPAGYGIKKGGQHSRLRIQVRWELGHSEIMGPWVQPAREAECQGPAIETALPPGGLFLTDSGFFSYERMAQMDEQGTYWLTSARADLIIYDEQGVRWDLPAYLARYGTQGCIDAQVHVGVQARMRCRLIAIHGSAPSHERVNVRHHMPHDRKGTHRLGPKAATGAKARTSKAKSQLKHTRISAGRRKLGGWKIVLTNVPQNQISAQEALVLMRMRWQQELLWKLWKQKNRIESWRSEKPVRIETEIYAKLLVVLIQHWEAILACWEDPRHSLVKAQQMSQWSASALCFALQGEMSLERVLFLIATRMGKAARINPRHKKPNSYQLLEDPKLISP